MGAVIAVLRHFFSSGKKIAEKKDQLAMQDATERQDFRMPDLATITERQGSALYPNLFSAALERENAPLYFKRRSGSGLVSMALRHSALNAAQVRELNEFRLDQYTLCGFYDLAYLQERQLERDPDLLDLPSDTIHIVIGTSNGRILAYSYMQPPQGTPSGGASTGHGPRMGDKVRPWFPCEVESFGPDIFSSLPALRDVAVAQIAEISILLRNQLEHGPSSLYAVAESVLAMALIQAAPSNRLLATVAYGGQEARQILYDLGIPGLYAPYAPVVYNALPPHWSASANIPGRFWPCVFSTEDFLQGFEHLRVLDSILDLPAHELRRELVKLRRSGRRIATRALVPEPRACNVVWITTPEAPDASHGAPAPPAQVREAYTQYTN
jgi:hypothetical protein